MNKKGRGLVQGIVIGVAALVISVIIAFIIVSNVATVDDDIAATIKVTSTNETASGITAVNGTTYTVTEASKTGFAGFVVHELWNGTTLIGSGNYTVSATAGTIVGTAGRTDNYTGVTKLSYDYTWTPTENTGDLMISNFTSGVDNVSSKIPTILLIAAVVLILGILVLLWNQYQRMGLGGGSEL